MYAANTVYVCFYRQLVLEQRSICVFLDCDAEFFMMIEGQCIACPSGSSRATGDPQDRCDCDGGMATDDGDIFTSDVNVPCDSECVGLLGFWWELVIAPSCMNGEEACTVTTLTPTVLTTEEGSEL